MHERFQTFDKGTVHAVELELLHVVAAVGRGLPDHRHDLAGPIDGMITAYHRIVATLRRLGHDETLLVQSGKPVGVFRTHPDAPRVLIANALLVPAWGDWEHFRAYEAKGLTMYGQMTAGPWIYIGTQGILQGT